MLEKQLWEPAGLTQRVPAADNCTEIAIAANKVMAEIKVNLRNFMLPPRCACLQSNGAGSGLNVWTMLRVVYTNPGWSYLIPSYPSQLHAMTLYEISAGSCQIHERLGSWIQLRRGWRCQSSNNQHVPVLQQRCRMSRAIKFCETRKDEGTCGRVVDLCNYASTTDQERCAVWQQHRRVRTPLHCHGSRRQEGPCSRVVDLRTVRMG